MSATIYEFPVRGRYTGGQREDFKTVTNLAASRVGRVVTDASWYHEEAIEADRTSKN